MVFIKVFITGLLTATAFGWLFKSAEQDKKSKMVSFYLEVDLDMFSKDIAALPDRIEDFIQDAYQRQVPIDWPRKPLELGQSLKNMLNYVLNQRYQTLKKFDSIPNGKIASPFTNHSEMILDEFRNIHEINTVEVKHLLPKTENEQLKQQFIETVNQLFEANIMESIDAAEINLEFFKIKKHIMDVKKRNEAVNLLLDMIINEKVDYEQFHEYFNLQIQPK